ncbi:MAG: hypothetical protein HGA86_07505 [Anaerolineaceae bacterium]|nr:hypothetical protein [Anaerolineaceae bacterium]
MKKTTILVVILSVAIVALSVTGFVYARFIAPTAANSALQTGLNGRGDFGFGRMGDDMPGTGVMHDEMIKAMAEKLGLSVDDLNKKLTAGETMWSIAQTNGTSEADFITMMTDARQVAIAARHQVVPEQVRNRFTRSGCVSWTPESTLAMMTPDPFSPTEVSQVL